MKRIRTTLKNSIVTFLDGSVKLAPLGSKTPDNLPEEVELTDEEFKHESVQEQLRKRNIVILTDPTAKKEVTIAESKKHPNIKSELPKSAPEHVDFKNFDDDVPTTMNPDYVEDAPVKRGKAK